MIPCTYNHGAKFSQNFNFMVQKGQIQYTFCVAVCVSMSVKMFLGTFWVWELAVGQIQEYKGKQYHDNFSRVINFAIGNPIVNIAKICLL